MEEKHRRIPYGTMNWELIVRECHFVDNTAYIRALENWRLCEPDYAVLVPDPSLWGNDNKFYLLGRIVGK